MPPEIIISRKNRFYIIIAALLALFLSALDALIMGPAMPTIVADLGGLPLYSWVFSAYLLSRAVSLPIFGKLCDIFNNKTLYNISIGIFLAGSVFAGISQNMTQLIFSRVLQGIGAGGSFALVYIVLADISSLEKRGKMMSLASFVWGLASVLGPTCGGLIVNYFSWRWVFFINLPIGSISLLGISLFLVETRQKRKETSIDYLGVLTLSTTILGLLFAFLLAGRQYDWLSPQIIGLFLITAGFGAAFYQVEKRAREPILSISFFGVRGFSVGNGTAFFSSVAIFSLSAFSPLYIQGALGKTPAQLGLAMVPLSLGWSVGALCCGQVVNRLGHRPCALLGSLLLLTGSGITLTFSSSTALTVFSLALALAGLGMGFVSISTLLVVQNSLELSNLGVATSSHQFTRTLGGTIGIGISGSLVTAMLANIMDSLINFDLKAKLPLTVSGQIRKNIESLFQPEIQSLLAPDVQKILQEAVGQAVMTVFWVALLAALICFVLSFMLPKPDLPADLIKEPQK
ncbi:MAG: MFS transporter [Proteobacteria bacterium]|nr:MFS transporter [Pseudomonadota bacterium]